MTTTATGAPKGAPRRSKGTSSTNGKGAYVEWHGLKLAVPTDPPGDLAFSIENGEASAAVQEIFGDTQYAQIRERLKEEGATLKQAFTGLRDLLNLCFAEWDLEAGE